jgi:hypothetical protein
MRQAAYAGSARRVSDVIELLITVRLASGPAPVGLDAPS